jgi:spermidine synthase
VVRFEDETHSTARDEPPQLVSGVDDVPDERLAHASTVSYDARLEGAQERVRQSARATFALLTLLYFASGAVGLVDEVVFSKYFAYAFGATAHASSAVLVAFMTGLALGAMAAAHFDSRIERPLFAYGVLEIAVGGACVLAPWLLVTVTDVYGSIVVGASSLATIQLVRGALAGSVVLLPTAAMGATLPLVARVAGEAAGGAQRRLVLLYGANTVGGAVGSLLGAYVVVPWLGLAASLRAGASVSVAIGVAAIALGRSVRVEGLGGGSNRCAANGASATASRRPVPIEVSLFLAAGASGGLVFASEVVFVHLLALVDGTSVYAFGVVMAVFLVALSAGASASRGLVRRAGEDALSASFAISGLVLAVTVPLWDRLPDLFVAAGPYVTSWMGREVVRAMVAALAIGLPAACMGMTFPIVLGRVAHRADRGMQTGRIAAANTIASIAGSLVGGFVLLPALGSQRSCWVIALAYCIAGLSVRMRAKRWISGTTAIATMVVLATPRWDMARLASGANVYFERQPEQGPVVWIDEDLHGGVVTVTRDDGTSATSPRRGQDRGDLYTLWTNGKYQGDNGLQIAAQRGFADVPAMFVRHFGRSLVIGLGTGTTLGALARYPFEHIEVAELSPGIVAAARTFFAHVNGGVLADQRVHVMLEDGRNTLLVEHSGYDLVTVELTSIWFAGAANLYSREFYALTARRLNDGGVLSQWIQLHHTTLREIASQLATARAVFPHAAFFVRGNQGMLVLSATHLQARRRSPSDLDDLMLADETLDAFVDDVCARQHLTRDAILSTDDDRRLEYATPRNNVPGMPSIDEMTAELRRWRRQEVAERILAP